MPLTHQQNADVLSANHRQSQSLARPQQLAYAAPVLGVVLLMGPVGVIQGIYAKYFGLSLATIASILLLVRIFDAITDPLVGYFSDRYAQRTGSRKPFILVGALLFMASSFFLYIPLRPDTVGPDTPVSAFYFLLSYLFFYLGATIFEVSHLSWGASLSTTVDGKNTVFGWRAAAGMVGALLFYAIPLLPFFESKAFTPETLQWTVVLSALVLLPALVVSLRYVPNTILGFSQSPATSVSPDKKIKPNTAFSHKGLRASLAASNDVLRTLWSNKPLLLFYLASLFNSIGMGVFGGLEFIYIDSYLGMGEYFAHINVIGMLVSLGCMIFWRKLAVYFGKKVIFIIALVLIASSLVILSLLEPGQTSFVQLLIPQLFYYVGMAAQQIVAVSFLSDLIDYGSLKSRKDYTATLFALNAFIGKSTWAIGGAAGLAIAGWYGFDPAAPMVTEEITFGLRLAIGGMPLVFVSIAVVFILLIPLKTRHCEIIRRRLNSRAQAQPFKQDNSMGTL